MNVCTKVMTIHPTADKIFQTGPKWWTEQPTGRQHVWQLRTKHSSSVVVVGSGVCELTNQQRLSIRGGDLKRQELRQSFSSILVVTQNKIMNPRMSTIYPI